MWRTFTWTALALCTVRPARAQCDLRAPLTPLPKYSADAARGGGDPLIVPTVVHLHYGGLLLPLGILRVQALLDECNRDLRAQNPDLADVVPGIAPLIGDMGIELRLATRDEQGSCMSGIRYHFYDPENSQPDHVGATLDTRSYLNIHIGANGSFATLPGSMSDPYDPTDVVMVSLGQAGVGARTLTHEVGHWGGLLHTFGWTQGVCGEDFINDTPETAGSPLNCVLDLDDCAPGSIANVQNHMDYSDCRIMFTQGQVAYVQAVLADTGRVRAGVLTPANLLATGVTDPATCAITAGMHFRQSISCTGSTVSFSAMAEHSTADSVRWTFTGGEPATSTDDQPVVFYASSGSHPVQLTVYGGGGGATVSQAVVVDIPENGANGLATVAEFPFIEGFEGDFTMPMPHLVTAPSPVATWERFDEAGHASAQSLFVPPGDVTVADTSDLVIGNFDLSGLTQPTVEFKVSSSYYPLVAWCQLELHFRDQCSNIFLGNPWRTWWFNEMAADNGPGFTPSTDDQWTTLSATFPEWHLATSAELVLRLLRPAQPPGLMREAFYLDDLYVGEMPVVTDVAEHGAAPGFLIVPNPAQGAFTVQLPASVHGAEVRITDAMGKMVWRQRATGTTVRVEQALPTGLYVVQVQGIAGVQRVMFTP